MNSGGGSGLGGFKDNLAFDNLAQGDVFRRELFKRLYQRTAAVLELLDASGDNVDEQIWVGHRLKCLFDVIVTHGTGKV